MVYMLVNLNKKYSPHPLKGDFSLDRRLPLLRAYTKWNSKSMRPQPFIYYFITKPFDNFQCSRYTTVYAMHYVQASNLFNTKIFYFYYYFTVFRSVELSVRTHTQVHIFIEHIHTLWKIRFILFFRIFIYIYKIVSARDQHAAV